MSIEVIQLTKQYGQQIAVNNISFTIPKGEIVGFLGPNGAGKSTTMKMLTSFLNPTSGSLKVNGYDVLKQPLAVKGSIGYLPEHNPLYPEMYVREFSSFQASIYNTPKSRIKDVIALTGLLPEASKKIGQLSKGYRQRVGLAAALLHNPDVLILDEPTTGLDPNQLLEIRHLIKEVGKEKTVLLSTHIMQEVSAICDRVIIINKGTIVADKRLNELQQNKEQLIEVAFDYKVEEQIFYKAFQTLTKVVCIHDTLYELSFSSEKDMRPSVFDFAHDNDLKIIQLHHKNKDLESLFRELTV